MILSYKMKWRLTITIWTLLCISLASSAPAHIQDDPIFMYPVEYYPAYMQNDFAELDIAKWFRKAANSVKQFCNYVNTLVFGGEERHSIQNPDFKNNINTSDGRVDQELDLNLPHVQFYEMYKDSNGNTVMKKWNNRNESEQIVQKIPIKSEVTANEPVNILINDNLPSREMNSGIAKNPFHWNDELEKDELLSGAFKNYAVNPQLLWHSGIFPFQPIKSSNNMGEHISNESEANQSSDISDKSPNSKINSQKMEQTVSSTTVITDQAEVGTMTKETQSDKTSRISEPSIDKNDLPDKENNPSQNKSNADETSNTRQIKPEKGQTSDVSDEITNEDDDNNLTEPELDMDQISSDDVSYQKSEDSEATENSSKDNTYEEDRYESDDNDSTSPETPAPEEKTEKITITEDASNVENNEIKYNRHDSDESDIAKKVLAIVQPSEK